jgi:hypothetical protein
VITPQSMPEPINSSRRPLPCPVLPIAPTECWEDLVSTFAKTPVLEFSQQWLSCPDASFLPGSVRIGWHGADFFYFATLQDAHPSTRATAHNQRLWLLGDVLEVFAGIPQEPAYIEYHTAPNEMALHLLWPESTALAAANTSPDGVTPYIIQDRTAKAISRTTPQGWQVLGRISLFSAFSKPVGSLNNSIWDLNFGRYDYTGDQTTISSTSPLTHPNFHRRSEWIPVQFIESIP